MLHTPSLPAAPQLRRILSVFSGELLTVATAAVTRFSLGVWVYQQSGSAQQYSLILICMVLPGLLIAPWAGSIIDRSNRRHVIIAADSAMAGIAVFLTAYLWIGQLQSWHLFVVSGLVSCCQAFKGPAYLAMASVLVPREQQGRFSGLLQAAYSGSQIAAPILGGLLLAQVDLFAITGFNIAAYVLAIGLMLSIRSVDDAPVRRFTAAPAASDQGIAAALRFLQRNEALLLLLGFGALVNFALSMTLVLLTPMILARHSPLELGLLMSIGATGALAGSLSIALLGTPKRLVAMMFGSDILFGISTALLGVAHSIPLLAICIFIAMMCSPVFLSCHQTLWQRKTPFGLQGRIFSLNHLLLAGVMPVAAGIGGLVADHFFEPALRVGGPLAASLGVWFGVGQGSGIALMFFITGGLAVLLGSLALLQPAVRQLEQRVPDAQ